MPAMTTPLGASARIAAAGAVGVLGLMGLAMAGAAAPAPAAAVALAIAAAAAVLAITFAQASAPAHADSASRATEPPYERLLESLPEPVLLVGREPRADARLLFANRAARDLLPISGVGAVLAAAVRQPAALEVIDAALDGAPAEAEFDTGGSTERVWRIIAHPLAFSAGSAAVVLLRDETEVRRVERMRADFLANASHELRTPLASLTGFIETLQGPARDDEPARERFLAIMSEQAGRMGRLINDLLSLSRIELNEHVPPSGRVDLSAIVRDVLDAMGPTPDGAPARAEIRTALAERGGAMVIGDRDQLIQVAQNLIDNALRYAGAQGGVSIEVVADAALDTALAPRDTLAMRMSLVSPDHATGERYGVLRVVDDGPGIAREHLTRLSERFFRVEGQQSGKRLGTGLGLAIVKHILNRHKGGLAVESAPGRGAAFIAYVPMAPAPEDRP